MSERVIIGKGEPNSVSCLFSVVRVCGSLLSRPSSAALCMSTGNWIQATRSYPFSFPRVSASVLPRASNPPFLNLPHADFGFSSNGLCSISYALDPVFLSFLLSAPCAPPCTSIHIAPLPERTTGIVLSKIFRSSQRDQLSI